MQWDCRCVILIVYGIIRIVDCMKDRVLRCGAVCGVKRMEAIMARVRKKSAAPVYAVAITWVLWATVLPMYKISHFVILSFFSLLAYKVTGIFFRGKWVEVDDPEPVYASSGNPEVDALIAQGRDSIREMRKLNEQIKDKKISTQINRLEQLSNEIFAQVTKNPSKLSQIRKFMNYYLPTTVKLLASYAEVSAQSVRGKNITATMQKVENIMDTIIVAFEKQLDSLFGAEALDISTDITVLEGILAREGLTEKASMKAAVTQNRENQ